MKRILAFIMSFGLGVAVLAEDNELNVVRAYDATSILKSATSFSKTIDLGGYKPTGTAMAFQLYVTNQTAGVTVEAVTIDAYVSVDGVSFPTYTNVFTAACLTNSTDGAGRSIVRFDPGLTRYIKFKAVNANSNAYVTGDVLIK